MATKSKRTIGDTEVVDRMIAMLTCELTLIDCDRIALEAKEAATKSHLSQLRLWRAAPALG